MKPVSSRVWSVLGLIVVVAGADCAGSGARPRAPGGDDTSPEPGPTGGASRPGGTGGGGTGGRAGSGGTGGSSVGSVADAGGATMDTAPAGTVTDAAGGAGGPDSAAGPLTPPPAAVLPVPTPQQLAWQRLGVTAFFHFGMNTFTDQNVGDGTADPMLFNPTGLDPAQWVRTVQSAGFKQGMLVAKHHDGFCLWQTKCSPYSVARSPWMGGKGDVVKAFTDAAHAANFRVGLYLSPLDNHSATSSASAGYAAIFRCEVEELLTKYGRVDEIWFDGNGAPSTVNSALYAHIKQLSPNTLIWTGPEIAGPGVDLRWVGNEGGRAPVGETSVRTLGGKVIWYPSESDVSIRPSWFYHASEDTRVKTLAQLTDIFFNTVGHNSVLLLNVPPNRAGVLPAPDVARIGQFGASITNLFTNNLAATRAAKADSTFHAQDYDAAKAVDENLDTFWAAAPGTTTGRLEVDLGGPQTVSIVDLSEPIALGERSSKYHVEIQAPGSTTWTTIATGTVIGQRNLIRVNPAQMAAKVALVIEAARGIPAIAELGVY